MDFIVSRVAMSVCALLVVGVLAGVVDIPQFEEPNAELSDIVDDLCRIAEEVAGSCAEVELVWTVPSLVSGETVRLTIASELILAGCAGSKAVARPSCDIHLWDWDGSMLNRSRVDALDALSAPLQASSGDLIMLESIGVEYEDLLRSMLFVRRAG